MAGMKSTTVKGAEYSYFCQYQTHIKPILIMNIRTTKPAIVVRLLAKIELMAHLPHLPWLLHRRPFFLSLVNASNRENGVVHGDCQLEHHFHVVDLEETLL